MSDPRNRTPRAADGLLGHLTALQSILDTTAMKAMAYHEWTLADDLIEMRKHVLHEQHEIVARWRSEEALAADLADVPSDR